MYSVFDKLVWLCALSPHVVHEVGGDENGVFLSPTSLKMAAPEGRERDEKDFLIIQRPP
jgi:hypothetical protein